MAGGLPLPALRLAFIAFAASGAFCRQISMSAIHKLEPTALGRSAEPTGSWRSNNSVFTNSWVKQNIALTYAHRTGDGVGGQTMRLLGIYVIAKSLDLQYLHRPLRCVGHVSDRTQYRDSDCEYLVESERRLMRKLQQMVRLPSDVTEKQVHNWQVVRMQHARWESLSINIRDAYRVRRPTLLVIEYPKFALLGHPEVYLSVPAFRPEHPSARLVCRAAEAQDTAVTPGRSWLLNGLRVAVHFRRGDKTESKRWSRHLLPVQYYVNLVKQIVEVMDKAGCGFTVEVYSETPSTRKVKAELRKLKEQMPAAVMLISSDLAWTWQMMTTADVLIMSPSAFSLSAAVMNPNAVNIAYPNAKHKLLMDHWFATRDNNGTLPPEALETLRARLLMFQKRTEIPSHQGPCNFSQETIEAVPLGAARPQHNISTGGTTSLNPLALRQLPLQRIQQQQ